ncbi:hypothetical protein P4S73_16470 [Paraglaciecola sp. Hal342]
MKLKIAVCLMLGSLSVNALAATTYHYPKSTNQYGQLDYIFVTATNGSGFCEEKTDLLQKLLLGKCFAGKTSHLTTNLIGAAKHGFPNPPEVRISVTPYSNKLPVANVNITLVSSHR